MNIVSFYAPRPEHPFFQDYTPFLSLLRLSCARFGHRHIVLTDDPGMGEDAYVADLPRSLMRATIAAQLAYLSDPQFADAPTLLTGADCVLARDPAAMAGSDVAITTDDRFQDCRMNCGAIYTPRPAALAPVWRDALARCGDAWGDDQISVYAALQASGVEYSEFPCDPYNLAPEHPGDDCTRGVVLHFRGARKRWMVDYCHKWLGLGDGMTVQALPNSTRDAVLANVRANLASGFPCVPVTEAHDGHAVLVGSGPSLLDTLPEIARRQEAGQAIFALNGTGRWLIDHGVVPQFVVILDPRPGNARFAVDRGPGYLLASQCDPAVFDAAPDISMWHFAMDGIAELLPPDATLIGGGLTVGLTAMGLAFAMGYRKLHLYGYDSSDRHAAAHAFEQTESDAESARIEVWLGPQRFIAGAAMYAQAEAFPRWAAMLADAGAVITVHGDGLLPAIAHAMHGATLLQEDMAA